MKAKRTPMHRDRIVLFEHSKGDHPVDALLRGLDLSERGLAEVLTAAGYQATRESVQQNRKAAGVQFATIARMVGALGFRIVAERIDGPT